MNDDNVFDIGVRRVHKLAGPVIARVGEALEALIKPSADQALQFRGLLMGLVPEISAICDAVTSKGTAPVDYWNLHRAWSRVYPAVVDDEHFCEIVAAGLLFWRCAKVVRGDHPMFGRRLQNPRNEQGETFEKDRSSVVIDFRSRAQRSLVASATPRIHGALTVLMDLDADQLRSLTPALSVEIDNICNSLKTGEALDEIPRGSADFGRAWSLVCPNGVDDEHFHAIATTGLLLVCSAMANSK